MKKFVAVMTAAAMLTSLSACGASASTASSAAESTASSAAADSTTGSTADATTYKVAIVQQLDHASLDEIRTAIEAELDAKAAEKGITIEYKDFNGQNDATTLNQIGTQVVSDGYDAIIPIATLAAQCMATAAESTKTPVIYAAISDPAAADLTDIDYVTGTSDALNTQSIMDMISRPSACSTPTLKPTPRPPLPKPRLTSMPRALPTSKRPATPTMRS